MNKIKTYIKRTFDKKMMQKSLFLWHIVMKLVILVTGHKY
jgi:hypothetical protein